jgi:hypothetical protein
LGVVVNLELLELLELQPSYQRVWKAAKTQ